MCCLLQAEDVIRDVAVTGVQTCALPICYNFETRTGVIVTYHVEESPRIPAYFDNIPWFADSEVSDAIRRKLPYFDGTLPQGGDAVEQAAEAIKEIGRAHV